jgi:hypothetical protein
MSCRGLIAAVATVAAILSGDAGAGLASPQSRQEPDLAAYDLGVASGGGIVPLLPGSFRVLFLSRIRFIR